MNHDTNRVALHAREGNLLMIRLAERAEPIDYRPKGPQLLPSRRLLTAAHKTLITILAKHLVEEYLAEKEEP